MNTSTPFHFYRVSFTRPPNLSMGETALVHVANLSRNVRQGHLEEIFGSWVLDMSGILLPHGFRSHAPGFIFLFNEGHTFFYPLVFSSFHLSSDTLAFFFFFLLVPILH